MIFKPYYLGCLSHASYLLASDGDAVVIDPQRDVDQYLRAAEAAGVRIRWVIETHLHADFVSGHVELARRTGAKILIGRAAKAAFEHVPAEDGMEIPFGRARLRVLETPGHTPEGISLLLLDEEGVPTRLFTGDTLFIGDVGRPDLAASSGYTAEQMAELMYQSLHEKILPLPDSVEVWPAHGAGSACGRNISDESHSTIGAQRRTNPALQPMSRADFVRMVTQGLPPAPRYFARDAQANRLGAVPLSDLPQLALLDPAEVVRWRDAGATVLDVRGAPAFFEGHVPGAIGIGLEGQFASWAGTLLPHDRPNLIVAETEEKALEARTRLARVGLDHIVGWIPFDAWRGAGRPVAKLPRHDVASLRARLEARPAPAVLDVRRATEYAAGHIPGAINIPLDRLDSAIATGEWPREAETVVVCAGGYRSAIAVSILAANGYSKLSDLVGGTSAWMAAQNEARREEVSQ